MKNKTWVYGLIAILFIGVHCGNGNNSDLAPLFDDVPDTIPNAALFGNWYLQGDYTNSSQDCELDNLYLYSLDLQKLSQETSQQKGNCALTSDIGDDDFLNFDSGDNWNQTCQSGGSTFATTISSKETKSGCTGEVVWDVTLKMTNGKATGTIHTYYNISGNCTADMKKFDSCSATMNFTAEKVSSADTNPATDPILTDPEPGLPPDYSSPAIQDNSPKATPGVTPIPATPQDNSPKKTPSKNKLQT